MDTEDKRRKEKVREMIRERFFWSKPRRQKAF